MRDVCMGLQTDSTRLLNRPSPSGSAFICVHLRPIHGLDQRSSALLRKYTQTADSQGWGKLQLARNFSSANRSSHLHSSGRPATEPVMPGLSAASSSPVPNPNFHSSGRPAREPTMSGLPTATNVNADTPQAPPEPPTLGESIDTPGTTENGPSHRCPHRAPP